MLAAAMNVSVPFTVFPASPVRSLVRSSLNEAVPEARLAFKNFSNSSLSLCLHTFSRRNVLIATLVALPGSQGSTTAAAPFPTMEAPNLPGFVKTDIGVRIQEVVEGNGAAASAGDMVEFNYVCRRSNGYFVYSTVDQFNGESRPVTLPLDGKKMIAGLEKVLVGMKPGGKRRAVIPPAVGYITTDLEPQPREFGPQRSLLSHAKEPLLFEVQLLKIK